MKQEDVYVRTSGGPFVHDLRYRVRASVLPDDYPLQRDLWYPALDSCLTFGHVRSVSSHCGVEQVQAV